MYRIEVNGKPFNVTYGQEGEADAKARELFKTKGVRQVRVYENDRCVLHLGTAMVRKP